MKGTKVKFNNPKLDFVNHSENAGLRKDSFRVIRVFRFRGLSLFG